MDERSGGAPSRRLRLQRHPLLALVERRCPRLEGGHRLLHHLVEEEAGQARVQERLELKRHLQDTGGTVSETALGGNLRGLTAAVSGLRGHRPATQH